MYCECRASWTIEMPRGIAFANLIGFTKYKHAFGTWDSLREIIIKFLNSYTGWCKIVEGPSGGKRKIFFKITRQNSKSVYDICILLSWINSEFFKEEEEEKFEVIFLIFCPNVQKENRFITKTYFFNSLL